jgi:hypothetical protein
MVDMPSPSIEQEDDWQKLYQAALLELDPARLPERIEAAYKAIHVFMEKASHSYDDNQRQALADALASLRVLCREVGMPANGSSPKQSESSAS